MVVDLMENSYGGSAWESTRRLPIQFILQFILQIILRIASMIREILL
jgi:hypothetical protein